MAAARANDREISAEDIASWPTAQEAAAYAARIVGAKNASDAIWQLLVGGMIEAVANTSSTTRDGGVPISDPKPSIIPKGLWQHFRTEGSNLWGGGYARFRVFHRHGEGSVYQCYGIKLNPSDVKANLPPLPPERAPASEPLPIESRRVEQPDSTERGPPVSEAHMKAWYALYSQV